METDQMTVAQYMRATLIIDRVNESHEASVRVACARMFKDIWDREWGARRATWVKEKEALSSGL